MVDFSHWLLIHWSEVVNAYNVTITVLYHIITIAFRSTTILRYGITSNSNLYVERKPGYWSVTIYCTMKNVYPLVINL